jgi:hypothetical protein
MAVQVTGVNEPLTAHPTSRQGAAVKELTHAGLMHAEALSRFGQQ